MLKGIYFSLCILANCNFFPPLFICRTEPSGDETRPGDIPQTGGPAQARGQASDPHLPTHSPGPVPGC